MVVLREWAHKSLKEEEERPDSFLERFRGPDLQTLAAGGSDKDKDQEEGKKQK